MKRILFVALVVFLVSTLKFAEAADYTISIDLSDKNLTLKNSEGREVVQFPIATPRKTPSIFPIEGEVEKVVLNPSWRPTEPTRAAYFKKHKVELPELLLPGDSRNAMGEVKLMISWTKNKIFDVIRLHGTNDSKSIGTQVTRGCIRLHNEDIKKLAELINGKATHVIINW